MPEGRLQRTREAYRHRFADQWTRAERERRDILRLPVIDPDGTVRELAIDVLHDPDARLNDELHEAGYQGLVKGAIGGVDSCSWRAFSDGGSRTRSDFPESPRDPAVHDEGADARLRGNQGEGASATRAEDKETGISLRFIRQYDVEKDKHPTFEDAVRFSKLMDPNKFDIEP